MDEITKALGLSIYGYLEFLLEHCPNDYMTDDEQLTSLTSWREKLQTSKNRMRIIMNHSNWQAAEVLNLTALLFDDYPIFTFHYASTLIGFGSVMSAGRD